MDLAMQTYWVIDVEGNGGSPPEIVEIAMIEVRDLKLTGNRRNWLIKPGQPITAAVSQIHGLTNADVSEAPAIEDVADDILLWIEGMPIVGHNVRVEVDILSRSLPEWIPGVAIDTLKLARRLKPSLESYSLGKLGKSLGLERAATEQSGTGHHAALFDATLTAMLFIHLLDGLDAGEREVALRGADILDVRQGSLL